MGNGLFKCDDGFTKKCMASMLGKRKCYCENNETKEMSSIYMHKHNMIMMLVIIAVVIGGIYFYSKRH